MTNAPVPHQAQPNVVQIFEKNKQAINDALPKHMTSTRMIRVALTELRRNPGLQRCDPLSFLGAIVQASQLGLEPGNALGHCYLIPYGQEVTLQLGYRGMIDIARRSGNIISISARCVYEGDKFDVTLGTEESLTHVPAAQHGEMTAVYAVAKLRDGGVQFEAMSRAEVEHVRDTYSQGYKRDPKKSPWATSFEEMAKKTVVRRLFKMLPTSIEIRDAVRVDEDNDQHNAKTIIPDYEVLPQRVDPDRISAAQNEPAEGYASEPAKKAERDYAIKQFTAAATRARTLKLDVDKIIGGKVNDVMLATNNDSIYAAADLLERAINAN